MIFILKIKPAMKRIFTRHKFSKETDYLHENACLLLPNTCLNDCNSITGISIACNFPIDINYQLSSLMDD
jgi:hypothetical protein